MNYPTNGAQYEQFRVGLNQRNQNLKMKAQTSSGRQLFPTTITPVPQSRPSKNVNELPLKGFQADYLTTYIIPHHDKKQLALYSRHILKNPDADGNDLVSQAQERIAKRNPQFKSNQSLYEMDLRRKMGSGGVNMNPRMISGQVFE